jgi:hypothetical protein
VVTFLQTVVFYFCVVVQGMNQYIVICLFKQGGFENMELARAHYCLALKLSPSNIRALYGLFLVRDVIVCMAYLSSWKNKQG